MATPLRKDRPEDRPEEELTTADLAHPQVLEPTGPKPVASERSAGNTEPTPAPTAHEGASPLFPENELGSLRDRWKEIQTNFVDEPRKAVEQADGLVASAMKRLAEVFSEERNKLEGQWDRGDNVSTEDLRVALQRYRTFFQRLLSV
jgi:hypothetical protein